MAGHKKSSQSNHYSRAYNLSDHGQSEEAVEALLETEALVEVPVETPADVLVEDTMAVDAVIEHEVGTSIEINAEDADLVRASDECVAQAQHDLGAKREEYLAVENVLFSAIVKARNEFNSVISDIMKKSGIDIETRPESWNFNVTNMTFTRVK